MFRVDDKTQTCSKLTTKMTPGLISKFYLDAFIISLEDIVKVCDRVCFTENGNEGIRDGVCYGVSF